MTARPSMFDLRVRDLEHGAVGNQLAALKQSMEAPRLEEKRRAKLESQWYSLSPSTSPAVAVVRIRQGRGLDPGELDFALKHLKKSLDRSGHHTTRLRASMTQPRRTRFKRRMSAKRRARAAAARRRREAMLDDA